MKLDSRYTITMEFCGYPEARHVVRFCGEWVGQAETKEGAEKLAENYENDRWLNK